MVAEIRIWRLTINVVTYRSHSPGKKTQETLNLQATLDRLLEKTLNRVPERGYMGNLE